MDKMRNSEISVESSIPGLFWSNTSWWFEVSNFFSKVEDVQS